MIETGSDHQLSDYLFEVQAKLALSESEMKDALQVTDRGWSKITSGTAPSLVALTNFAEFLDVDLENLFHRKLDLKALRARKSGQPDALPERYVAGAHSRMRTSQTLLNFIEFHFGWRLRSRIMKKLNMTEKATEDSDRFVNINFFMDICDQMKSMNYSNDVLFRMGQFSVYSNRGGAVGSMFEDCQTPRLVYEKIVPILGTFFDKNYQYRILKLTDDYVDMEAKVQEQLASELNTKKVGSIHGCLTRAGVGSSFVFYAGAYVPHIHERRCMHIHGGDRCLFRISWSPVKPLSFS